MDIPAPVRTVGTLRGGHVVVVGAGVGGMATSLLLARSGAQVTLLERRPATDVEGAGILLQPNGLAVLTALGLAEQLRSAGHVMRTSSVRNARGRQLLKIATPDFGVGLDHVLALRRSALQEVLREAVQDSPGIEQRFDAEVHDAEATGVVEHLSSSGSCTTLEAALIVGADGVHSTIRAAGDFGAGRRRTGHSYLRALVPRRDDLTLEGEFWTPLGLVGGAPLDEHTQYLYADASAAVVADAVEAGEMSVLRDVWACTLPLAGSLLQAVGDVDELIISEVVRVDCARWHDGRLVLLGDAAHAMAPNLGQGANSALVDAAVLALELEAEGSVEEALQRYTLRRRPAVRRVQQRADAAARLSAVRSRAGAAVRDLSMRGSARLPRMAERSVRAAQQEDPERLLLALSAGARL
jgi:2-polyprenyl-6-methoxyphenol hydroxylase-like FAD-dependent oxidoreductase